MPLLMEDQAFVGNKKNELQAVAQKISEMQMEQEEHQMVLQTLRPMDPQRACFRLINGVLIERTVNEVIPVLEGQLGNIEKLLETLQSKSADLEKQLTP